MFQLVTCGYHFVHEDGIIINRPSGSGNYSFVFFKSNSELQLHGTTYRIEKNSYILLRPDTSHLYRELDKPFINDWFHCQCEDMEEYLSAIQFPLDTPIRAEDSYLISRSIKDMNNTIKQNNLLQDQIIDCDLRSLLMKLATLQDKSAILEKTSRHFLQFSKLRNDLYLTPIQPTSVEKLAASLNLSKSHFQHLYKQLFGCSVVTDIINARLEYAKYLLTNTNLSVHVIASMCGYENDTHFMRQFKKFVGTTPSQYKAGQLK